MPPQGKEKACALETGWFSLKGACHMLEPSSPAVKRPLCGGIEPPLCLLFSRADTSCLNSFMIRCKLHTQGAGNTQSGPPNPLATSPGLLSSNLAPHLGPLGAPLRTLMPLSFFCTGVSCSFIKGAEHLRALSHLVLTVPLTVLGAPDWDTLTISSSLSELHLIVSHHPRGRKVDPIVTFVLCCPRLFQSGPSPSALVTPRSP